MQVIEIFPDLKAIGREKLQALADRWVSTAVPKECAVSHVTISETDGKLELHFGVKLTHKVEDGELYHFPMDDLIKYWCEYGIGNSRKREKIVSDLHGARARLGPNVFQRFHIKPGPQHPMLLKCKTCRAVSKTQYSRGENDRVLSWSGEMLCPKCGQNHSYDQDDFFISP